MYDHFQKMRQLARGEGKIEFSLDIRCIGTSGKTARSACPKVDLLPNRNVWKRGVAPGKNVPQMKRARIPCILLLYVKRTIVRIKSSPNRLLFNNTSPVKLRPPGAHGQIVFQVNL